MKKTLAVFLSTAIAAFSAASGFAAEAQSTAKVLKVTGAAAQVQLPGEAAPRALNVGEDLPQGAPVPPGPGTGG